MWKDRTFSSKSLSTGKAGETLEEIGHFKYARPAELLIREKPRIFLRRFMPTTLSPKLRLQLW